MTSKSTKEPWSIDAPDFGKSLKGIGFNLLVADMARAVAFAKTVLQAEIRYWNEDFAVVTLGGGEWMLHADHTYSDNPLLGFVRNEDGSPIEGRGIGAEFHLYNQDPDAAEQRARDFGAIVLAGCLNKPHGLRECYILDPDGYCWVVSRPLAGGEE
jgi:uncharacterized glyoxalase superfamily protein PhnB